jgi:hypothetical protein
MAALANNVLRIVIPPVFASQSGSAPSATQFRCPVASASRFGEEAMTPSQSGLGITMPRQENQKKWVNATCGT